MCKKAGYSNIEYAKFSDYQSITSDAAADLVIKHLRNCTKGHVLVRGHSSVDVETAVSIATLAANVSNCAVHFRNFSHSLKETHAD